MGVCPQSSQCFLLENFQCSVRQGHLVQKLAANGKTPRKRIKLYSSPTRFWTAIAKKSA